MNHTKYLEMMELALLQELNDEELEELHKHLLDCDDCQFEYDRLNKFYKAIDSIKSPRTKSEKIIEELLPPARRNLRIAINEEISKKSFLVKIFEGIKNFSFYFYRPVLTGALSLAVGLSLGYLFFHTNTENALISSFISDQDQTKITNVHFINPGVTNGEVEFIFEAVKPVTIKGNISDPKIQMILAQTLLNEKNPGTRINTVSALANQTGRSIADPKIKSALISTLKYDSNPGVRRQALGALLNFPFDGEIKNTLLYSLVNDKNPGIRIAAINGLTSANINGQKFDEQTLKVLKQKSQNDDNEYIRIRAASLIKEAQL